MEKKFSILSFQLQDLLLWLIEENPNKEINWIKFNKKDFDNIIFITCDDLNQKLVFDYKDQLQTIYKLMTQGTAINTYSPGREDKCYPGIPSILKMKQKKKSSKKEKEKEETQSIQKKEETDKLIQNKNFKFKADSFINSNQTSDFFEQCEKSNLGFVKTKSFYSQETNFPYDSKSKIFAIDCEMCGTEKGSEVTKICIIDDNFRQIYSELVVPDSPIRDLRTRFSGITLEDMSKARKTLKDVQEDILKIIPSEACIVGHSILHDFLCLKLIHTNVLDTAALYSHDKVKEFHPALKRLSEKFLFTPIQQNVEKGHNPFEDATTSLKLLFLKMIHGPDFGIENDNQLRSYFGNYEEDESLIFEIISQKRELYLIDTEMVLKRFKIRTQAYPFIVTKDEEIPSKFEEVFKSIQIRKSNKPNFIWAQFQSLKQFFFSVFDDKHPTVKNRLELILTRIDQYFSTILEMVPKNSLIIFYLPEGNGKELNQLKQEKEADQIKFESTLKNKLIQVAQETKKGATIFLQVD